MHDGSKLTKYQTFIIERVHRSQINEAYYNPRKMTDENRKGLGKIIKEHGLVEALVWNARSGNLVGGHQRLSEIDRLEKHGDYYIDVCKVDVDDYTEAQLNLILNNTSIMGEYDKEKLQGIRDQFPQIDFIKDVCFTKQDVEFLQLDFVEMESEKKDKPYEKKVESLEKYKESYDNFKKNEIQQEKINGNSVSHPERNDKCLTIVFENNIEKWDFMRSINQNENDKFLKYIDIIDAIKEEYRI